MHLRRFFIPLSVLTLAAAGWAQGPWAKKDWRHWSAEECKKILEDSPWAHRVVQSDAKMANFARPTGGTEGVGMESETSVFYIVQFRSARPIREAFARQVLLQNHYDQLDSIQKESLEKQVTGFLNRDYKDVIVVHVIYGSNVLQYNRDLVAFWQNHYPEGVVPQEAFLNGPKGQKLTPVRLLSPKSAMQEFELIFPRIVDGKSLLETSDKTISVEFVSPGIGQVDSFRVFAEFKPEKMTFNGDLAY